MDEKDLVSGCQRADNRYRHYLYDKYANQMMSICYRYAGDREVAEDLMHDGFIRIFEAIHLFEYRGAGSLRAWMTRIFTNTALDYLRKNDLFSSVSLEGRPEPEAVEEEDFELIPADVLMRFIAELSPGYRAVFNLNTFDRMSHKEIAGILKINESSSRSQLTRAKAILAQKVKDYIREHE